MKITDKITMEVNNAYNMGQCQCTDIEYCECGACGMMKQCKRYKELKATK